LRSQFCPEMLIPIQNLMSSVSLLTLCTGLGIGTLPLLARHRMTFNWPAACGVREIHACRLLGAGTLWRINPVRAVRLANVRQQRISQMDGILRATPCARRHVTPLRVHIFPVIAMGQALACHVRPDVAGTQLVHVRLALTKRVVARHYPFPRMRLLLRASSVDCAHSTPVIVAEKRRESF